MRAPPGIPQYALDYAPLIFLHSDDPYRPSDIGSMLSNTKPEVNFQPVAGAPSPLTLDNLNVLNDFGGDSVYLTAVKDVATDTEQSWLKGVSPDQNGFTNGAVSATIIVNEKDSVTTDVFYFYFYNFNAGPPINILGLKLVFGNHVGDWEHMMVRFINGKPTQVWYSQHATGQAFTYEATRKIGNRPIGYSAKGSHANYATDGLHDHTIPNLNLPGSLFLTDTTNAGPLWDPLLSAYFYKFDATSGTVSAYDPSSPVSWLYYKGKWGDQQYPTSHTNQIVVFGQAKFGGGPTGPLTKELQRNNACPNSVNPCLVLPFLTAKLER
ncbi:hypothetical protein H072_6583 [Dactylellina haptotyla CBS 200.50]|uniref:Vacuolar protein sorting-associated protein 62 n=1 Tax=Dactylellina haptotyla (strain CBS 200.50) TaxID=1284197 RepID=S8BJY9_DACHA|nr:hypothetical protein H072_6583 [Dactylellina haptotyla CBS 200.50]